MDYQIESTEYINDFIVTNYIPKQADIKIQKQIILSIYNIFSNDNECIDIKEKDIL